MQGRIQLLETGEISVWLVFGHQILVDLHGILGSKFPRAGEFLIIKSLVSVLQSITSLRIVDSDFLLSAGHLKVERSWRENSVKSSKWPDQADSLAIKQRAKYGLNIEWLLGQEGLSPLPQSQTFRSELPVSQNKSAPRDQQEHLLPINLAKKTSSLRTIPSTVDLKLSNLHLISRR